MEFAARVDRRYSRRAGRVIWYLRVSVDPGLHRSLLLVRLIVVMVEPGSHLDGLFGLERVGFEVESIDDALRERRR